MNQPLVYQLFRQEHCWVAKLGTDKRWKHISAKPTPRWEFIDFPKITGLIGSRCKSSNGFSRGVLINHLSFDILSAWVSKFHKRKYIDTDFTNLVCKNLVYREVNQSTARLRKQDWVLWWRLYQSCPTCSHFEHRSLPQLNKFQNLISWIF